MKYNNKFRKNLYERIGTLSATEHEEIFKIIQKHDVQFMQNKNGIFFNISTIDDAIVEDLDNFIKYCMSNKSELDEYDKRLNECKMNHNLSSIASNSQKPVLIEGSLTLDEWSMVDTTKLLKFNSFVERMNADKDKVSKKKVNVKFHNAKKKYSKKVTGVSQEYEDEEKFEDI
jgi:hypothetical protein